MRDGCCARRLAPSILSATDDSAPPRPVRPMPDRSADAELLRRLIKQSGLSINAYGPWVLGRSARTLYRWLNESSPMSPEARGFLQRLRSVSVIDDELHICVRRGAVGSAWKRERERAAKPRGVVSRRQRAGK